MNRIILLFTCIYLISCGSEIKENPKEISNFTETIEFIDTIDNVNDSEVVEQDEQPSDNIERFANAVINDDRSLVASLIEYPLSRPSPIPAILSEQELLTNYDSIFDDSLKHLLNEHLKNPDFIDLSGSNGTIGILNGFIWFNSDEKQVISINYSSIVEQNKQKTTEAFVRKNIHPILNDYIANVFIGKTETYLIRIDITEKGLRYASWYSDETMNDEPDFILWDGVEERQGSGGGWQTSFDNADTRYLLDQVRLCADPADCGDFLIIEDEGELTSKEVIVEILNPLEVLP